MAHFKLVDQFHDYSWCVRFGISIELFIIISKYGIDSDCTSEGSSAPMNVVGLEAREDRGVPVVSAITVVVSEFSMEVTGDLIGHLVSINCYYNFGRLNS